MSENPTFNVECVLHRKGGTVVTIDEIDYHFKPNQQGAHVCEISDPDHAQTFLAIREAYAIYTEGKGPRTQEQLIRERRQSSADDEGPSGDQGFTVVDDFVDDDEGVDPLEVEARQDPDGASNKALQRWATLREFNHRNKQSIFDYGLHTFGVELDRDLTAINMVRELVKIEVAHLEGEDE